MRSALLILLIATSVVFSVAVGVAHSRFINGTLPLSDRVALHFRLYNNRVRILLTSADRPVRYTIMRHVLTVTTLDGFDSARLSFVSTANLRNRTTTAPNGVPAIRWRWVQPAISPQSARVEISYVRFPAWLPPIVLLIYPAAVALQRIGERRRPRLGACPNCGYDLTGNVSGLCSECGEPIAGHRE